MKGDERFRKAERITRKKDFERIFKQGKRKRAGLLTLIYVPSVCCQELTPDTTSNPVDRRIGIILDRRIKGAVVRNRLKRRLRDIYRKNKASFKGEYIILAYPGAESMTYSELSEEIIKLLK